MSLFIECSTKYVIFALRLLVLSSSSIYYLDCQHPKESQRRCLLIGLTELLDTRMKRIVRSYKNQEDTFEDKNIEKNRL